MAIILAITAAVTKIARGGRRRSATDPTCKMPPPPPVVNSIALLRLLPTLFRSGLPAILHELYTKFGSVFTINLAGLLKMTFLVGPEVSAHFFQGLESEISHGNLLEFTVPMFGKEIAHGVDSATRNEQARFFVDALKPARLRIHVDPMVQEVEDYFAKWGQHGTVDLRRELEQLLLLISGRCLLGKEVMGTMFDEVCNLFRDIEGGVNLMSVFFPYTPLIPSNRRRDMARKRLHAIFSDIVRSRKQREGDNVDKDVLQSLIDSSVWTGARLLSHERFLTAAVDEQDKIAREHSNINGGGRITDDRYGSLMEMRTLHSCIKETLRLHPPVPMLVRTAHKQFTVRTREGHEYAVPAGHTIASPIVISNQVPYIYKDGHLYDPDRFGPAGREEDKVGGKFSYASFGGGRTGCVGEGYAYMQIKAIWSHLLRNFELRLLSPLPKSDFTKFVPEPHGELMIYHPVASPAPEPSSP
uniref:Cytochrome P450 n=1 Tax=Oryza sativa subsp. japonica TaxID=39947 RepID=Q6AT80_ORYSJ|nr:putative cytochrome P450 [Oryza sativa Japonica Group]